MDFIRFKIWPWVKVKATYWRWVIKYGGKKNIPSKVVFGAMEKTLEEMNEEFMNAVRVGDSKDMDDEEKKMISNLMSKMSELGREVKNLGKDDKN